MISDFRADLHCHTTCSDGSFTPVQLVDLAKQIGLSGVSITDHDTIEAYQTAIKAAKASGIVLGTGVEFSCEYRGCLVHVLGYDFRLDNDAVEQLCRRHQIRRTERNGAMLSKLAELGMYIPKEELAAQGEKTIGRPHIAKLMVEKGFVQTIKEAFQLYLGEGKAAYVQGEPFSIQETIEVLHTAKGKAFLAHPLLIQPSSIVKELLKMNFDGLEGHYSRFTKEQMAKWVQAAHERGWLISGGSDFHGQMKPDIPLGCSWVDNESFYKIFEHPL
jgi:3',5'-nucleoside bisphosphate phosphatase